jgi:endonuclease/exonuclease/phosphatase (EEP) superfamily protein YafD
MKTIKVKIKRQKPKRSYKAVIESLRMVWQIERVADGDSIWQLGEAELPAFAPDNIRVAVWNLCKGAGGMLFEHDYRSLCYRSDLILTQEALLSRRSLRMFCERGFQTIHAASYKRRDGLRDGVMTVSRVAPAGPSMRVVCKYPEPIFRTPKVALIKTFKIAGSEDPLLVINIHATLVRLKAAAMEEMEHLLSHLPEHRGPIILAGDFNTFTPGYLRAVTLVLERLGLRYVHIPDDPRPRTQALDQVFCRGLDVHSAMIDTTIRNSDHFPILLTLSLQRS